MTKTSRARSTQEFKQEAVRLVEGGQSIAAAARTLGVVEQTLFNWVKANRRSRLRAELARVACLGATSSAGKHQTVTKAQMRKACYFFSSKLFNAYNTYLAPQPGLEPGTYGLLVRTNKYSLPLIDVAILNINQQLMPEFQGFSVSIR